MNLLFPWMGATIEAAGPAAVKSLGQVALKTNQAFGDLLSQIVQTEGNGPSEAPALSQVDEPPKLSAAEELRRWLTEASERLSLPVSPGEFSLFVAEPNEIKVEGPEPLRSELAHHIHGSREVQNALLNELKNSGPPQGRFHLASTDGNIGMRIEL